jgi:hypothetical protein
MGSEVSMLVLQEVRDVSKPMWTALAQFDLDLTEKKTQEIFLFFLIFFFFLFLLQWTVRQQVIDKLIY